MANKNYDELIQGAKNPEELADIMKDWQADQEELALLARADEVRKRRESAGKTTPTADDEDE